MEVGDNLAAGLSITTLCQDIQKAATGRGNLMRAGNFQLGANMMFEDGFYRVNEVAERLKLSRSAPLAAVKGARMAQAVAASR